MTKPTTSDPAAQVQLRSFSQSLPMTLLLAREAVMNRFRGSLHRFDVTEQQWRVLRAVQAMPGIEITELAKATSLLAPSLSRILRDLEARGLVLRRQSPSDMRRALISLAPDGERLIQAIAPYSEAAYAEIWETYGPERMEELQRLLKELADRLNALPPPDLDGVPSPAADER